MNTTKYNTLLSEAILAEMDGKPNRLRALLEDVLLYVHHMVPGGGAEPTDEEMQGCIEYCEAKVPRLCSAIEDGRAKTFNYFSTTILCYLRQVRRASRLSNKNLM